MSFCSSKKKKRKKKSRLHFFPHVVRWFASPQSVLKHERFGRRESISALEPRAQGGRSACVGSGRRFVATETTSRPRFHRWRFRSKLALARRQGCGSPERTKAAVASRAASPSLSAAAAWASKELRRRWSQQQQSREQRGRFALVVVALPTSTATAALVPPREGRRPNARLGAP